jgi:molecular chaperone GrpE
MTTVENAETQQTENQEAVDAAVDAAAAEANIADAAEAQASLEQELLLMKDQLLRSLADNDNLRKRSARELEDANKYAITGFARDVVGVSENLHRALQSIPADAANDANMKLVVEGIQMTLQELNNILTRHGIRRIDPAGEKFDHNFHQAMAQVESAEVPANHVLQVLQAGYAIHDRLLRPAMVAVSKGAPAGDATPASVDTQA